MSGNLNEYKVHALYRGVLYKGYGLQLSKGNSF